MRACENRHVGVPSLDVWTLGVGRGEEGREKKRQRGGVQLDEKEDEQEVTGRDGRVGEMGGDRAFLHSTSALKKRGRQK